MLSLDSILRNVARPLSSDADLDPLLERIGDARVVMLGEASHGTSEYYTWRDRITRRLVAEKGFRTIAVEGDWPDCYRIDQWIRGSSPEDSATAVLRTFDRWPTWMWANEEVVALATWLRRHNDTQPESRRVGFYGLDVYSLYDSMRTVLEYLGRVDPDAARRARSAYGCFDPYREDVQEYAMATSLVPKSCEDEAVQTLRSLRHNAAQYREDGSESFFNAEQNALVARNAELYYRTMVRGGPASWNVRDSHMQETLERLLDHQGPDAKAIVWEHNTHIGDARATDMAAAGMHNIGQLARERWGMADVVLVGFAGYEGSVIAGRGWGEEMQRMTVPPAREGSWEARLHAALGRDALLISDELMDTPAVEQPYGHRAIGVVYHPDRESLGNYVPTILGSRYDAVLYLEHTSALRPITVAGHWSNDPPETWPSGE